METWMWVVAGVAVALGLLIIALAAWAASKRRSARLREGFGPEYQRTVEETGDRRKAEKDLAARRDRVQKLRIRPLAAEDRERFAGRWERVQAHFVDEPTQAVAEADRLVSEVMRNRGYPVEGDFEQRASDVSVDHPEVVSNYRAAHRISQASDQKQATTEELRQAMVHYRALFTDLLGTTAREEKDEAARARPR